MQPSIRHPQMRRMVSVCRSFVAVATVVVACLLLPLMAEDLSAQLADTNQYTPIEIILFPFDSASSLHPVCKFQGPSPRPGRDRFNTEESDQGRGSWSKERVYDISLTEPGATVVEHLVWSDNAGLQTDHIVVVITGHLFSEVYGGKGAGVDPDAVLLEVDILGEIADGRRYGVGDNQGATASHDPSLVYTTLQLHKSDLDPSHGGSLYNYDRYRSIAIPVDLSGLNNVGIGGSSSQANATRPFDLRVRWTGAEKVALRSITVRNGVVQ